jgi:hypothetical protein
VRNTRGRWCEIIILNVHFPTEDKIDDTENFYKGLELLFNHFLKLNIQNLLEDFTTKFE